MFVGFIHVSVPHPFSCPSNTPSSTSQSKRKQGPILPMSRALPGAGQVVWAHVERIQRGERVQGRAGGREEGREEQEEERTEGVGRKGDHI